MSELFMECEEEELEPWQKAITEINLVEDDDDDEPIFVGEIQSSKPINSRHTPGQQNVMAARYSGSVSTTSPQKPPPATTQPTKHGPYANRSQSVASPVLITASSPQGGVQNVSRVVSSATPQPIIINNQGYIVTSPQISNNSSLIASLRSEYPPGTSFKVLPAAQSINPEGTTSKPAQGVVHRPQVQLIQNNVVTLSNPRCPPEPSAQPTVHHIAISQQRVGTNNATSKPMQVTLESGQMKVASHVRQDNVAALTSIQPVNKDNGTLLKRVFPLDNDDKVKRSRLGMGIFKPSESAENETPLKKNCPKCGINFRVPDPLRRHMKSCCPQLIDNEYPMCSNPDKPVSSFRSFDVEKGKLIMLVSDFYYGQCDGDRVHNAEQKTITTFKCNSCLKVLKNNIRFMNHMKHHLELEKQNSESWESHTTCQHCYRQYSTPFQLQCHVESAHSPFESTTNCKICELAFETEQVLLEHMKDNHKPGEMPYACQVCNYRSSFFSDVETHFRTVHENTKDLLCPFCLKVLRSGHMYMQHYMRHQKKGIHRCGKCRLNFLTYKEKVEHKTHFHRTYRKPKSLEGLPPGTKVTIRASLTGGSPTSSSTTSRSSISVVPSSPVSKQTARAQAKLPHTQIPLSIRAKGSTSKKQDRQKPQEKFNDFLKNLRSSAVNICIECSFEVKDYYDHFSIILGCSACKYRTCCRKSFSNHMIRFHSSISKDRFRKMNRHRSALRNLTLVCLNCDFLVSASASDLMSKHLIDRPNHTCQVIMEQNVRAMRNQDHQRKDFNRERCNVEGPEEGSRTDKDSSLNSAGNANSTSRSDGTKDDPEGEGSRSSNRDEDDKKEESSQNAEEETETIQTQTADKEGQERELEEPTPPPEPREDGAPVEEDEASFKEFLSKPDNPRSVSSYHSEHSSTQLEPLTPSKILEDEATEIQPEVPDTEAVSDHEEAPSSPGKAKESSLA
ncbi:zinc finger protein 280C isoform X2 [Denticeps clupeoides]|uniref:C2H2-type domain-containing protein n=1 Tax=Denticeps clupeoides TaxID=299321 RepID=A0AAY4B5B5_9TELE|nr:zinc finger protein 280C-like isoform X2 [Denticeps clupeoides]